MVSRPAHRRDSRHDAAASACVIGRRVHVCDATFRWNSWTLRVGRLDDLSDLILGLQVAVVVMVGGALLMFLVMYFIRRDGLCHPELEGFHAEPGD